MTADRRAGPITRRWRVRCIAGRRAYDTLVRWLFGRPTVP